ncbi:MAG: CHAT domain-containing protein [Cyanobacteria bacterium J06627_28]
MFKLKSVSNLKKTLPQRQGLTQMKHWLWATLMLASLWMTLALNAYGFQRVQTTVTEKTTQSVIVSPLETTWQQNVTAGVDAFEQGRLADAINSWELALSAVEQSASDPTSSYDLTKAYLLSNLAAAYQQLGQLSATQTAIAESLEIVNAWPAESQSYWEISARALNTQGQLLYQQGQTQQALTTWQQAASSYRSAQQPSGLIKSQINQAIALQELGFNVRAVRQLTQLGQQLSASSSSLELELQLDSARELGRALRRVGELTEAQSVLSDSLQLAASIGSPASSMTTQPLRAALRTALKLELGHTLRALSHRAIAIGRTEMATDYREQALAAYASVRTYGEASLDSAITDNAVTDNAVTDNAVTDSRALYVQAQLNQLSYLIETGQIEDARAFWPQVDLSGLASGRDRTEAYVSYAHSLNCLRSPLSAACVRKEWQGTVDESSNRETLPTQQLIADILTTAVQQAQTLADALLASYATGELGHTYELANQPAEAIQLTQRALSELEGKQIPEAAYRWEWQLGRLYSNSTSPRSIEPPVAIAAYQQALTSLNAVRQNLLLINLQAQFSFRDDVEPLYREFVTLLLNQQTADANAPTPDRLSLAVETVDALQLTELENFLGCNLSQLVNLTDENTAENTDPTAAKLYPILLSDQLATIIDIPGQPLSLRTIPVSQQQVEETIRALRNNLTLPGKTPEVLTFAEQLYQWLIAPVEPILAVNEQIKTLVFVPDGPLRNVPMGVLYDGQQYLIEKKYAIAIAPQLSLFAPKPTPPQLKILRGGLSLPQTVRGRRFPAIELVQAELEQIPAELSVTSPLLDEAFTQANIEQQLAKEQYNAIHWKTHGVFSADPTETFLVAYEDGITANELSNLVQSARAQQTEPLELLVLSACETAQGDRRAVLGLAGIAVRAGTRSTLSTLWRADDGANTELMDGFYQGLQQGLTKAQALQRSQQRLLTEAGYPAPYYWAPYVLVGNWL